MEPKTPSRALAIALFMLTLLPASAIPTDARAESLTPATGIIKGTLVDANGQPLVGYTMRVIGPDGVAHVSMPTTANGLYEIKDLPPATYSYEILDQNGAKVAVRVPPVRLDAGMSVTQPIAIVPSRGGRGRAVAWTLGSIGIYGAVVAAIHNYGSSPSMSP